MVKNSACDQEYIVGLFPISFKKYTQVHCFKGIKIEGLKIILILILKTQ